MALRDLASEPPAHARTPADDGDDDDSRDLRAALRAFRARAEAAAPRGRWLRYRADRRTVATVLAALGLVALASVAPRSARGLQFVLAPLCCVAAFLCAVATHNSAHVPVFRAAWMNRVFSALLSLAFGHPACGFEPGHNLSHHRFSQTARDATRTTRLRFRWNLLNQLLFYPAAAGAMARGELRYLRAARRAAPAWFWQYLLEAALILALYTAMIAVDLRLFVLCGLLPHAYATWGIVGINFAQHDGCDPASAVNHSRNFVGRTLNALAFNNGYHAVHHLAPELHWSVLPRAHAEVLHGRVHPALEQPSLPAWLVRSFVWPGRRLAFDGRPVVLPPPEPDVDWIDARWSEGS